MTFASTTAPVCTTGGTNGATLTFVMPGTCTIKASQTGNAGYAAATDVIQSLAIAKAAQPSLVATASPSSISPTGAATLSTTGGAGTGAVSFELTSGTTACTLAGSRVSGARAGSGSCIVSATKAADAFYNAASTTVSIAVDIVSQTITFPAIAAQTYAPGRTVALAATASSGLAVAFASTTADVCTVAGSTATLVSAGTCTMKAAQSGDATFAAASDVMQSFTVGKADQSPLTATATPPSVLVGGTAALATSGGSGTGGVGYAVTSGMSSCSVVASTLTGTAAGACTVTATKAADARYNATTATLSVSVAKVAQSITFTVPAT